MPQIDFNTPLFDFDNEQIAINLGADQNNKIVPATLSVISVASLLNSTGEDVPNGQEKWERYELSKKIHKAEKINLTLEEIVLLKRLIAYSWPPLIQGLCWEILDPQ